MAAAGDDYVFKLKFDRPGQGTETRRYGLKGHIDRQAVFQSLYERTGQVFGLNRDSFTLSIVKDGNHVPLNTFQSFQHEIVRGMGDQIKRDDKARVVIVLHVDLQPAPVSRPLHETNGYSVKYTSNPIKATEHQPKQEDGWTSAKSMLTRFVSDFNAHMLDTFGDQARPLKLSMGQPVPATPSNIAAFHDHPRDNSAEPPVHRNVFCDRCLHTIVGTRYKCTECSNYDLCEKCFGNGSPFHHAGHNFKVMDKPHQETGQVRQRQGDKSTDVSQGTALAHPATCDLCDKTIRGCRHKCQQCPDYDVCASCLPKTRDLHPGHAFVPIRHPSDYQSRPTPSDTSIHFAVRCDGCNKSPIRGVRYKCVHPDCPDFDLCENCEADPIERHPRFHPLLKLRAPIPFDQTAHCAAIAQSVLAPPQKPAEEEVVQQVAKTEALTVDAVEKASELAAREPRALKAEYVADVTLEDGTVVAPGSELTKVWSVINTGNASWPLGTRLVNVGGWTRFQSGSTAVREFKVDHLAVAGEQVEISCDIKAPEDDGDYVDFWRLTDERGEPFGDRLWISLQVRSHAHAASSSSASLSHSSLVIPPHPSVSVSTESHQDESDDFEHADEEEEEEASLFDSASENDADDFVVLSGGSESHSERD